MNNCPESQPKFSIGLNIYIILSYILWYAILTYNGSIGAVIVAYVATPFLICINGGIAILVLALAYRKHPKMPTSILNLVIGFIAYAIIMASFN